VETRPAFELRFLFLKYDPSKHRFNRTWNSYSAFALPGEIEFLSCSVEEFFQSYQTFSKAPEAIEALEFVLADKLDSLPNYTLYGPTAGKNIRTTERSFQEFKDGIVSASVFLV
jgi:hypothetical protein